VFQALRIAVNGELDEIERGLRGAVALLRPGGRLAVISFTRWKTGW
jgi:16S rRNA (cytosine1402-N4)-methyltransferase